MGGGDTREPLAIVGETPNIAARLQDIAAPDTVVLSAATYRLIQGYFEYQDLVPTRFWGLQLLSLGTTSRARASAQSRFEVVTTYRPDTTQWVGKQEV